MWTMQFDEARTGGAAGGPPGGPWRELGDSGSGYLSVYLSEPLARWPIREITRPADNKSDPNIETGTYGLFSTCEPTMRNRIVQDKAATIFFVTTHKKRQGRILCGYYHVGWYTEGSQGATNHDYALAAASVRFIEPIRTIGLPAPLASICSAPFRTMKPIDAPLTSALRALCNERQDRTHDYLHEVIRIERFARARSGYAYPSWGRELGFTWEDARDYYWAGAAALKVPNSSRTGDWLCRACGAAIRSGALLKRCPVCHGMSTLMPRQES